jgi:disulfide bond formation protein DsbB
MGIMSLTPRNAIAALLALALVVVAYVLFSQYVQGYLPCELCLRERLPWYAAIALGAIGLVRPSPWIVALLGGAFLIGAAFGLHHVGVEQRWWLGPAACTSSFDANSIEELRKKLQSAPVVQCDVISWTLFGLSMTTYNFLVSSAAGVFALFATWRFIGAKHA